MAAPEFMKPIKFTPDAESGEQLEYLHSRTALKGAVVIRRAIKALELQERAAEAAERAGQAAREKATGMGAGAGI